MAMMESKGRARRPLPEYVAVGLVLGPFGPSGLVRVRPLTDFPERLAELGSCRLSGQGVGTRGPEWVKVVSARESGGEYVLELEGLKARQQASALRGALLEIPVAEVRPLPPDRFYRFQVIGLLVRDESGAEIGRVSEVLETGANDVFVVLPEGGAEGPGGAKGPGGYGEEILLPALKDVVRRIDLDEGVMVVRLPKVWDGRV